MVSGLAEGCLIWRILLARCRQVVAELMLKAVGTGGGTRTHTRIAPQRILSPLRLPFRHTGIASPSESSASSGPARSGTVQNHTSPSGRKKTKTSLNHSSRLEWMGSANLLSVCDR